MGRQFPVVSVFKKFQDFQFVFCLNIPLDCWKQNALVLVVEKWNNKVSLEMKMSQEISLPIPYVAIRNKQQEWETKYKSGASATNTNF